MVSGQLDEGQGGSGWVRVGQGGSGWVRGQGGRVGQGGSGWVRVGKVVTDRFWWGRAADERF